MAFRRGQGRGRGEARGKSAPWGRTGGSSRAKGSSRGRRGTGGRAPGTQPAGRGGTGRAPLIRGRFTVQRSGVGFVLPAAGRGGDIFIHPANFGEAWHGDEVEVSLLPRRGRNREGVVVAVLARGRAELVAEIMHACGRKGWLCRPVDERLRFSLLAVASEDLDAELRRGDLALLRPGELLERGLWAAEIIADYGAGDDLAAQERIVKAGHGIPTEFPPEVLAEAAAVQRAGRAELPNPAGPDRRDLREIPFVTIDGENARDFDDAIYVETRPGGYRLWVAIADVAHYVRPLSALDREALNRGNSYYFPQSVEPMLPEALSNDLCSLRPNEPRLGLAVRLDFDSEGRPESGAEFCAALLQSRARLTYAQVFAGVIERDAPAAGTGPDELAPHWAMLKSAERLARLLHARRQEAGGLDFELPEPEIRLAGDGATAHLAREEHNFSHRLIEMFMVAANEAVARFLTRRRQPFPLRVHPQPDPDKLWGLFETLRRTGLAELPKNPGPRSLPGILEAARGTEAEFVVARLVLRAMMQARYSLEADGHFGLASDCYCHFTSPIRRYADLLTHRALKHALGLDGCGPLPERPRLEAMLDTVNHNEQAAKDAEREILRRMTVLLLQDQVGNVFAGVVSGVSDFGVFVELEETLAEGLIRLERLADDVYDYFPERQELLGRRTRQRFCLGRALRVRLVEANIRRLELNLEPVAERRETAADRAGRDGPRGPFRRAGKKA